MRLAKNEATRRWNPFVLAQLIFNSIFNVDKMLHDVARTTCHTAHGSWQLAGGRWSSKWQFVKIFAININYAHKVKSLAAFRLIINALGAKQKRERERKRREGVCGDRQCAVAACLRHATTALGRLFVLRLHTLPLAFQLRQLECVCGDMKGVFRLLQA